MRKENIGKFMSVKDLTTYEVLKDEDLKGIKAKGKLLKHIFCIIHWIPSICLRV